MGVTEMKHKIPLPAAVLVAALLGLAIAVAAQAITQCAIS